MKRRDLESDRGMLSIGVGWHYEHSNKTHHNRHKS